MDFLNKLRSRLGDYFVPSEKNSFRPHSLRRDFLISIVAIVCVVEGFLAASLMMQSGAPHFSASVLQGALVSLTNSARATEHQPVLTENAVLTLAAQAKAEDMAAGGYFAHVGPGGKQAWDWMKEAGYEYAYAGENLAAHFYDSSEVVEAWLDSPSHRANILRPNYREVGIGVAHGTYDGADTIFVVQLFGVSKAALGIPGTAKVALAATAEELDAVPQSVAEPFVSEPDEIAQSGFPVVEGVSTVAAPSFIQKLLASPGTTATWILFGVLFVIALSIALAVFIRIRIQPVDLLINGMVIAAFVLSLVATNSYFFSSVDTAGSEAAAISAFEPAQ